MGGRKVGWGGREGGRVRGSLSFNEAKIGSELVRLGCFIRP